MNPAEFDFIARAEQHFWWYRGMQQIMFALLDKVNLKSGSRVLEAGCGTGFFAKSLAERYAWRMVPVDLGAEGLVYAKGMGLSCLVQSDIVGLPFRDSSFDAVVSMDVVVHLPRGEEEKAFSEFARVINPGGHLILRVSALDILRSQHSIHATERQRFTRSRLIEQIIRNGFTVDWCSYANSILMPIALIKFRIIEPLSGGEPESGVQPVPPWLDAILSAALRFESLCLGRRISFPIGQSLILLARKAGATKSDTA